MLPDIWKVKKVLAEFCGVFDAEGDMGDGLGDGAEKASKKKSEKEYEGGSGGFWDDFALVSFLEGVCWRYVAHPVSIPPDSSSFSINLGRVIGTTSDRGCIAR